MLTPSDTLSSFYTGSGLDNLAGVAVDNSGNIYVADNGSNGGTLGIFSPSGAYQTAESIPLISGVSSLEFPPAPVPEPSGTAVLLSGLGVVCLRRSKTKRNSLRLRKSVAV